MEQILGASALSQPSERLEQACSSSPISAGPIAAYLVWMSNTNDMREGFLKGTGCCA